MSLFIVSVNNGSLRKEFDKKKNILEIGQREGRSAVQIQITGLKKWRGK